MRRPSFLLSQIEPSHGAGDLDDQPRLNLELFRIGQSKVLKYVSGTGFNINTVNRPLCHLESPLPESRQP